MKKIPRFLLLLFTNCTVSVPLVMTEAPQHYRIIGPPVEAVDCSSFLFCSPISDCLFDFHRNQPSVSAALNRAIQKAPDGTDGLIKIEIFQEHGDLWFANYCVRVKGTPVIIQP